MEKTVGSTKLLEAQARFTETIQDALERVPFVNLRQPLYHFTDKAGLEGILRTRCLWASLAMALEDTSEIKYALAYAKRILESHDRSSDSSILDEIVPFLNPQESKTISTLGMKTYVVSFRTNVDESAHWETYGRSGTGFALAFALKPLVIPGILPLPVLYDPEAQEKLLREFIEVNAELFDKLSQECPAEELWALRQRAIQWTALGLWTLAPILKDPARFRHENEWRLIVVDLEHVQVRYGKGLSNEVRVRRSNGRDIPYKVLEYDSLPIVGLELGPNAPVEENDASLIELLRHATSGRDVPIARSKVVFGHHAG